MNAIVFYLLLGTLALYFFRRRWQPSRSAFGTSTFAPTQLLQALGMLGSKGLILLAV